jgi:hypothetical protein
MHRRARRSNVSVELGVVSLKHGAEYSMTKPDTAAVFLAWVWPRMAAKANPRA